MTKAETEVSAPPKELYPGSGTRANGRPKLPSMTPTGVEEYAARESDAVGHHLVSLRLKAFSSSLKQPEKKLQVGAAEDAAAALIAWAQHQRLIHHIPAK